MKGEMKHVSQMKGVDITVPHLDLEVKLAWIVHIVALILRKQYATRVDAELVGPALQFVEVVESGLQKLPRDEAVLMSLETLNVAVLILLQNLWTSYVGDYTQTNRHPFKDYQSLLNLFF